MIKLLSGVSLCVLLVACGGSSYSPPPTPTPVPTPVPTPPPVALDVSSQVTAQLALSETSTEMSEPVSVETVTVPEPEDTEPSSL